jgi:leader peptidase (prepilin peptidase)/N-methyltransferase
LTGEIPRWLWIGACAAFGLAVGSFLNVAIHRFPDEAQSVRRPRRSYCPACGRILAWTENVPLVSFALQGGRCRGCRARISWRYPAVEALNALAWAYVASREGPEAWAMVLVHAVVLSGLIVATFVDFAHLEIPDSVSLGGCALAPVASFLIPELHRGSALALAVSGGQSPIGRGASLTVCLAGMATGAVVLLAIGWIGKRVYGRDAMGLGDVKLLAAGGGFVGPGGAVLALVIAAVAASAAGLLSMARWACVSGRRSRARGSRRGLARAVRTARVLGRYIPFGPYLGMGIGIALLAWNDVAAWLR